MNVVEVAPVGIVTVVGTFAARDDELIATLAPGDTAGAVSATVHVDAAGAVRVTGMQEKPFKAGVCWMVTVPPLPDTVKEDPAGSAAEVLGSWTAVELLVVDDDSVKETLATTPLEIVVEFRPHRTQLNTPEPPLQETDLFAALAAGPTATLANEKSTEEYDRVQ